MQERIQIHVAAVQEAERRSSEALLQASKEHNRNVDDQAASLARLQRQADNSQQQLAAKEAQVTDLQSRLDGLTAQLKGMQRVPDASAELHQVLAAKEAEIAGVRRQLDEAVSYRKKCHALAKECKQLHNSEQAAANQPLQAAETTTTESQRLFRENLKLYLRKKSERYLEAKATLEECKRRMLANGLQYPGPIHPDEEESNSDWDPFAAEEAAPASQLQDDGRELKDKALQADGSGHRTAIVAPGNATVPSDLPSTEEEASSDDIRCCTVLYKSAGPAERTKTDPAPPGSAPETGAETAPADQGARNDPRLPAGPASPRRDPQQHHAQFTEQSDGEQKSKRGVAMCGATTYGGGAGGSSPKRQRTEGVLRDADINTLAASQDSTEAPQTANACPPAVDEAADAFLSSTQLTVDTRQRYAQAIQADRDSEDHSENIDCTPQSRRHAQSAPAPAQAAAEAQPGDAAPLQDGAIPWSPAWQLKSRDLPAERECAAAVLREMSLHLSQLQPPAPWEPAETAPFKPAGRPNLFSRAAQHAHAAGARPPPKWNQKQRGPALPDALAFLDLRQTQQAASRAHQQLPTIVERHINASRAAAEPLPQSQKPDNQPQNRLGEPGYKYKETVRKKAEREELTGVECVDCRKFYAAIETWGAVGDLPACGHAVGGEPPSLLHLPFPVLMLLHHSAAGAQPGNGAAEFVNGAARLGDGAARSAREQLRQDGSRHRYRYEPPATPAGFWDLGFMDSQDSRVQPQNYGRKEDEACS